MAISRKTKKWIEQNGIPSLEGMTVVITGANSGVGLKSAEIMVYLKAKVIMACRSREKAEAAKAALIREYPGAQIDILTLNLASFSSIDAFISEIAARKTDINVFLNNAGVLRSHNKTTADGLELILGTNYFGVYYLTEKLIPYLSALPHGVLYINTVSIAQKSAKIDYSDFFRTKKPNDFILYARSKLCLAKYTFYKAKQNENGNIKFVMSHPGIAMTPLGINAFGGIVNKAAKLLKFIFNSPEKSALSLPLIISGNPPAGSLCGPTKFFGGWGYPETGPAAKRAKTGAEELIEFTEKTINAITQGEND